MGILDWFKNRASPFDAHSPPDEMTVRAIDKAVTLINPRLKIVDSYQQILAPAVDTSLAYLRQLVAALPAAIEVSGAQWTANPLLRAFFVAASDIQVSVARSPNLRTLFEKYPAIDEACFVLAMNFDEQRVLGMAMSGELLQREVAQTVIGFSSHQARICGQDDAEVRQLLATRAYEYLVAQALSEIADERSERRQLEDSRSLLRSRLRLLEQQGPGLGSVFGAAPAASGEELKLAAQLLDNERQLEAIGSPQSALSDELEALRDVLANPQRYVRVEHKQLRLSSMNVLLNPASSDSASDVAFSLAHLTGVPRLQSAFVLARFARSELPAVRINFAEAERYL